ncbi:MAG: cytochrome P450, partial [Bacteroidota bacterium]
MPDIKTIPAIPRLVSLARSFKFVKNPVPIMNEAIDVYGDTYKMYMGGLIAGYVTREPAVVQHVLQKNHRNYKKSKLATETVARYVGKGLLTSDGDYWLQQRRLIQPGFHRAKLAALVDIMNKVIDEVVDDMTHLAKAGQPADLEEWMMKLAFNIVASTLFTTSMSEDDMRRLGQHISDLQGFIIREVRQPYLNPWFKLSGTRRYYERMAEDANDLIRKVIRERKQHGQRFDDLLDMLLAARYEDTGEGMNEQQLLEESLILFLAGHETTANALSWILYLLSQNETVYEKLMAEMDAVVTDGSV